MKTDIHPKYTSLKVTCSCGNSFQTNSTYGKDSIHIEACALCHPAYTGQKNKSSAAGDRVDRFNKRFNRSAKVEATGDAA
ncbi:MAG: 50S ribosomal protein L31 [Gammaproteobacteria bacterium]